jgi:negative regulator of sigma E activity
MNDFSEIENKLRELRPVQPSADFMARVERGLAEERQERSSQLRSETARVASTAGVLPRERRFHFNWLSLGLGLAAAAALVLFTRIQLERPVKKAPTLAAITPAPQFSSPISTAQFVPAGLTQVVYHTRDEGVHFPNNFEQPMRRVRSHTRETLRWRNPTTGASLRISYPSEEVSLVPVTGQ